MIERLAAIVAIPVKDEAERIVACLDALASQRDKRGRPLRAETFGVVLVLNNCTDGTVNVVRSVQHRLPYCLWIIDRELPKAMAHAGWARKLAMDAAADLLTAADASPPRLILTTDADGCVGPRWIAANLAAVATGADLVAGFVRADRVDHAQLPIEVIRRGRLESRYEWLLAELQARLDPEVHDPWPRHRIASGASLGVTLAAYRRVGGLSPIATGEDRALAEQLTLIDGRIRHCLAAQVVVSCRLDGRAVGGMAATIRQRALDPELACDPALEPAARLVRRARWRAELRRRHREGRLQPYEAWATMLQLGEAEAGRAVAMRQFGATWAAIEHASPTLAYQPLAPRQLPGQIVVADSVLDGLRGGCRLPMPLQHVDPIEFGPVLAHDLGGRGRGGDEVLRRRIAGQGIVGLARPMHQHDVAAGRDSPCDKGGHELEVAHAPIIDHLG
jgi:hypothetical protein